MQMQHNKVTKAQLKINMAFGPSDKIEGAAFIDEKPIEEDYLIVYVDITVNVIFAINLNSTAKLPIQLNYRELLKQVDNESIFLFEMEWDQKALWDLGSFSRSKQEKALERYEIIKPLIEELDSILRNDYGQKCFDQVIKNSGKSKQYVYDCFNGYFRMGQRIAGLTFPIGKNANHPSKKRVVRNKLGRPNRGIARGKVLEDFDYENFKKGKNLHAKRNGPSLLKVYKDLMRKHYAASKVLLDFKTQEKTGSRFRVKLRPS